MASTVKMSPRYVYEDNELGAFLLVSKQGMVACLYMSPQVHLHGERWREIESNMISEEDEQ